MGPVAGITQPGGDRRANCAAAAACYDRFPSRRRGSPILAAAGPSAGYRTS